MEQDATTIDEIKARRDALRERLRAKCEKIVAAVEALPEPKTFLEAERAARAVMLADKMVERVFSEPKAVKADARLGTGRTQMSESHAGNAPSGSTRFACDPPPPLGYAFAGEDDMAEFDEDLGDEDQEDETPLSKTYLKLEQLAAKITDLDAEFNSQKTSQKASKSPTQLGP